MKQSLFQKVTDSFFFANIFVAICAVSLCIETSVQHGLALNGIHFYTLIFFGTIYYYTFLYVKGLPPTNMNERVAWYRVKYSVLKKTQIMILIFLVADLLLFIWKYQKAFANLNNQKYGLILLFPLVAATYNFNVLPFPHMRKLRRIGWLKPFIIGFVWSGFVTVYPIIFYQIQVDSHAPIFSFPSGWLWLKNLMFISTLCIMFDIKDYEHDKAQGLKTFAVQFGERPTILYIIIPLVTIGMLAFLRFTIQHGFPTLRIAINSIPYILLLTSAFSLLHKKRSIIYYLFVIDGLMIVKALCGVAAVYLLT
jgi:4-hydroxybenzoate polyprenyltransferase